MTLREYIRKSPVLSVMIGKTDKGIQELIEVLPYDFLEDGNKCVYLDSEKKDYVILENLLTKPIESLEDEREKKLLAYIEKEYDVKDYLTELKDMVKGNKEVINTISEINKQLKYDIESFDADKYFKKGD